MSVPWNIYIYIDNHTHTATIAIDNESCVKLLSFFFKVGEFVFTHQLMARHVDTSWELLTSRTWW